MTFRMMENIKEINVAEIFVAAVDDVDPEAMFDLRGRDLPWYSATGQSPTSTNPANWKAPKTTAPGDISARKHIADVGAQRTTE